MKYLLFLLLTLAGWGQTLDAVNLKPFCGTAVLYGPAQQADMADLQIPYDNLLYAPVIKCDIPVTCVLCRVTLGFVENRSDPTLIGPGKRLFTVSLNGGVSEPLDLFTLVGPKNVMVRTWTFPVFDKTVHLVLKASLLNALLSTVMINNGAGIVGQPCAAPTDQTLPPIIYAVLPDGTCFPVTQVSPGFMSDAMAIWTAANEGPEIHVQSWFVVVKPPAILPQIPVDTPAPTQ